jgi:hypothetical protein
MVTVLSGISEGKLFTTMKNAEFLSEQGPHSIFLSVPLFSCLTHSGTDPLVLKVMSHTITARPTVWMPDVYHFFVRIYSAQLGRSRSLSISELFLADRPFSVVA